MNAEYQPYSTWQNKEDKAYKLWGFYYKAWNLPTSTNFQLLFPPIFHMIYWVCNYPELQKVLTQRLNSFTVHFPDFSIEFSWNLWVKEVSFLHPYNLKLEKYKSVGNAAP